MPVVNLQDKPARKDMRFLNKPLNINNWQRVMLRAKYVLFAVLFILSFYPEGIQAQSRYTFQQLDNRNGLSNSCINDIYQDSQNLIWLATWDGLNVFNGSSFHVFNYGKDISNSLASNVIYQLTEDKDNNIWICTVGGISKYNRKKASFEHYFYEVKNTPGRGYIQTIDNNGVVYAASNYSTAINYFDKVSNTFKPLNIENFGAGQVVKMGFDKAGVFYVLKDNGALDVFVKSKKGYRKRNTPINFLSDNFFFVNNKLVAISKNREIYEINQYFIPRKAGVVPHQVRAVAFYENHYVFAWASQGFGEYDANFQPISPIADNYPILNNMRIVSVSVSRENILWFGTDGSGVVKVGRKNDKLNVVQSLTNGQPLNIPIRAFSTIGDQLWVGTKGSGIIAISNLGKPNESFIRMNFFYAGNDLLDNCVYAIEKGKDGLVYIGSDAPGVTIYDQQTKRLIKWSEIKGSEKYASFSSVHSILYDADSSVWMGLNSSGLIHLKLQKQSNGNLALQFLNHYSYTGNEKGPGSDVIYTLARPDDNTIIAGCRYGGLSLFDKRTKKFKTLKAFSYEGSLSNSDILSLFIDARKRLWVGTSFGLNWINIADLKKKNPVFRNLSVESGLPNNTIHAIVEDNSENIWVSTNKGLAKLNSESPKIIQFKEADGLQSNEFSDNAIWKDNEGYLFFGGIRGFNYFLPEEVKMGGSQPNFLLSELHLGGRNFSERGFQVLNATKPASPLAYELGRDENYFELKLQPVAYTNLEKCRFAYFLKGTDKAWHYAELNQKVSYSNLAPGYYTLMVRWTNGEGAWTNEIATLKINVNQYFWLTFPAFFIYLIAFSTAGFMFLRYRKNKFILNQQLILEHSLREKDEQVHQEQLNFFTNIAHELQTPLTLIMGGIDRYIYKNHRNEKPNPNQAFLSVVKQEASRLHYLVHQLLEFRKAESGHLKTNLSYLNISSLLSNVSKLFYPLAEQKNLEFELNIEPEISLWMDKDKFEKIIFNLLSNAFKHSEENQKIICSMKALRENGQLELVVSNSGCTLTKEDLQKVFERFFVMDGTSQVKLSSGIGLSFTRQLVTLLKGKISADCEQDWIHFNVMLPLTFVPEESNKVVEYLEKNESPSYILTSITGEAPDMKKVNTVENNKKAMISSFNEKAKKSVLVVEDDEYIRFLLRDILSEYYIVYEANNGKEALSVVKKMIPDLIVSDIMMPDMDGLEFCNIIKSTPETCHVPFLILTARGTAEQKIEGYEVGTDAYIPKPFQADHLLIRIKNLLSYQEKMHVLFSQQGAIPSKIAEAGINDTDKKFIEKVIGVIEENLEDESMDSAFLEQKMAMSKMQIYRKIKSVSNMSPGELIKSVRIQQAANLLRTTNLTVSEIFYRTGFNNQSYFYREFKKAYSASPNEYRAQQKLPV